MSISSSLRPLDVGQFLIWNLMDYHEGVQTVRKSMDGGEERGWQEEGTFKSIVRFCVTP